MYKYWKTTGFVAVLVAVLVAVVAFASVSAAYARGPNRTGNGTGLAEPVLPDDSLAPLCAVTLSDEEATNLLYMREEEKLARDVYLTLYERWGLPVFDNIANSEQRHSDAIAVLLNRYGLNDPAVNLDVGVFANNDLQALYDQLVAQGSQSLAAALEVGATIEDLDIVDLQSAVAQADKADLIRVYRNLMKGSRNHLRAFVSTLQRQSGEVYQPQYLDQDSYDAIINISNLVSTIPSSRWTGDYQGC